MTGLTLLGFSVVDFGKKAMDTGMILTQAQYDGKPSYYADICRAVLANCTK